MTTQAKTYDTKFKAQRGVGFLATGRGAGDRTRRRDRGVEGGHRVVGGPARRRRTC
jgi:hypothetical protein